MPHSGAPKARGLTAKAPTERSSLLLRCASSSDTVREIKYQILHLNMAVEPLALCYPGLAGGTLRGRPRLDSERIEPFVDMSKLFTKKCPH